MALHVALDGDGPQPLAYVLSRMCEEFACVPSVALRELDELPVGLLDDILEARAYAHTKAAFERAGTRAAVDMLPRSDLLELVVAITFEREQARRG